MKEGFNPPDIGEDGYPHRRVSIGLMLSQREKFLEEFDAWKKQQASATRRLMLRIGLSAPRINFTLPSVHHNPRDETSESHSLLISDPTGECQVEFPAPLARSSINDAKTARGEIPIDWPNLKNTLWSADLRLTSIYLPGRDRRIITDIKFPFALTKEREFYPRKDFGFGLSLA